MVDGRFYTVAVEACGGTVVTRHTTAEGARQAAQRLTRTTGRDHIAVAVDDDGKILDV